MTHDSRKKRLTRQTSASLRSWVETARVPSSPSQMRRMEFKECCDGDQIHLTGNASVENFRHHPKQTDLANHSEIDGNWHFVPEILPKAVDSPDVGSVEGI